MTETTISLSTIEAELLSMEKGLDKISIQFGKKLLLIQRNKIYKQSNFTSFTAWLNHYLKTSDKKRTFLWESLSVAKFLESINFSNIEIEPSKPSGLYPISQIYKINQDKDEAISYINQLNDNKLTIKDLKQKLADIKTPSEEGGVEQPLGMWKIIKPVALFSLISAGLITALSVLDITIN
ncbi:hypothetical protein [Thalassotalea agarivorans]|uniref:Uncharacterized protein n=1 Tax=Thalassotalea agarivorans TaxID=349064 RepID=A0A1I0H400_THASX|nr:hypothetical protein [Thalassotalea agarivorans]SET78422.1 hypothetical protein SAMN05660429_02679 [Thalassotalea agarivorans]